MRFIKPVLIHILRFLKRYDWIILLGIIFIHLFVKDRILIASTIFYATPLPMLMVFSGVCVYLRRRNKMAVCVLGLLTLLICLFWISSSYKFRKNTVVSGKTLKVIFWNTARIRRHPSASLIRHLRSSKADVIGFVEAGRLTKQAIVDYQIAFPEHSVQQLSGGMWCMVKGTIKSVSYHRLPIIICWKWKLTITGIGW